MTISAIWVEFRQFADCYNAHCVKSTLRCIAYPLNSHGLTLQNTSLNEPHLTFHACTHLSIVQYVNCCYHAGCQVYTTIVHSKCSSGMHRFHSNRKGKHNVE